MKKYPPAFVTYGWCRTGYQVVRSLGEKGIPVHVGDSSKLAMSRYSRYASSFTRLPDLFSHPRQYFETVIKAAKKTGAKVILPCHEDILIFNRWREDLPDGIQVPLANKQMLENVESKLHCVDLAKKAGCLTPLTVQIRSYDEIIPACQKFSWPLVIKTQGGNGAKGVRIVHNIDQLICQFKELVTQFRLTADRWPLLQEFLPGAIVGVGVVYHQGKCVAHSADRYIRFKEDISGTATFREVLNDSDLVKQAISLMDVLNWHGIAQLEFIPDKYGKPRLNEINARPWGSMALAIGAGVDFPFYWYLSAFKNVSFKHVAPMQGIRCRWILGEVISALTQIKNKRLDKLLEILSFQENCCYDDFCLHDPLPFFFQNFDYLMKFVSARGDFNPATEGMID